MSGAFLGLLARGYAATITLNRIYCRAQQQLLLAVWWSSTAILLLPFPDFVANSNRGRRVLLLKDTSLMIFTNLACGIGRCRGLLLWREAFLEGCPQGQPRRRIVRLDHDRARWRRLVVLIIMMMMMIGSTLSTTGAFCSDKAASSWLGVIEASTTTATDGTGTSIFAT